MVDGDDTGTVEDSYRLPGHLWQIFLFSKEKGAVPELQACLLNEPKGSATKGKEGK